MALPVLVWARSNRAFLFGWIGPGREPSDTKSGGSDPSKNKRSESTTRSGSAPFVSSPTTASRSASSASTRPENAPRKRGWTWWRLHLTHGPPWSR